MPHCIVEHSENIQASALMDKVFEGAMASGTFEPSGQSIKVRSIPYQQFTTGGVKQAFVHVTLKILSGRNAREKKQLSDTVFAHLSQLDFADTSVTVEIVDIDKASYNKQVF